MTGFTELRDQANRATDLQEKELLLEQLEAIYSIPESVRQAILNLEMHL